MGTVNAFVVFVFIKASSVTSPFLRQLLSEACSKREERAELKDVGLTGHV